jgi:guanylate kinase
MLKKRIILVGKAGSGKDYLKNAFKAQGFRTEVSYTSRVPRPGEVDGETYHYASKEQFVRMIDDGLMQEQEEFGGWLYGTTKESWQTGQVFIKTPSWVRNTDRALRNQLYVVFLNISQDVRRSRLEARGDQNDRMEDRLVRDAMAFSFFDDYDLEIDDPTFDTNEVIQRCIEDASK